MSIQITDMWGDDNVPSKDEVKAFEIEDNVKFKEEYFSWIVDQVKELDSKDVNEDNSNNSND